MKDLTLAQIKILKQQLEKDISQLLETFQLESKVTVSRVCIDNVIIKDADFITSIFAKKDKSKFVVSVFCNCDL